MKYAAIIFLALASCGVFSEETGSVHDITVRRYEDVNGNEDVVDPNSLGLTYFVEVKGDAEHASLGMNCLINRKSLDGDPRLVGVIIHEIENALVLGDGDGYTPKYPDDLGPDWFLWDGDRYPMPTILAPEAHWLALHSGNRVHVQGRDAWMLEAVRTACQIINDAAEIEVVRAP